MIEIVLTLFAWALIVILTEALWRKKLLKGEYARKAVHISLAVWIAFLPFYLTWSEVQIIAAVGLVALIVNRTSTIFKSVYDIKRKSWGDVVGPLAMLMIALFEPSKYLFAMVVLNIGLSDGMAAVIGTRFGKNNRYKIFGHTKSIAGTATFFITTILVTTFVIVVGDIGSIGSLWPMILVMAVATTAVENISIYGADNASIAFTTVLIYNLFV